MNDNINDNILNDILNKNKLNNDEYDEILVKNNARDVVNRQLDLNNEIIMPKKNHKSKYNIKQVVNYMNDLIFTNKDLLIFSLIFLFLTNNYIKTIVTNGLTKVNFAVLRNDKAYLVISGLIFYVLCLLVRNYFNSY